MPFPPGAPTLNGDLLTIHRLLQEPTAIRRRLRTIADLRFVSDQILTQRFRSSGGAVSYEVSEPLFNVRPPEAVSPGSEYPYAETAEGAAALAAVQNWGQRTFLSDAKIKRSVMAGDELDRNLRKVMNTVIRHVDSVTTAAVASAVVATQAAGAAWTGAATVLRDVELAIAAVEDLDQGYKPDTIMMSSTKYALMASDEKLAALRQRETSDNPVYGGYIDKLAGLNVVKAPGSRLPNNDVWIIDSVQLGGMADEMEMDPGYTMGDLAVQVQNERIAGRDGWDLWGRRITVPVIQEPGAGIRITGT